MAQSSDQVQPLQSSRQSINAAANKTLVLDALPAMVQRLVDDLHPQQIILFGSWARGTATRRSDLDLLIICETKDSPLERIGRVLKLLADSPLPVEAIVYTPEELSRNRTLPFVQRVLEEGRVLYHAE